MNRDLLLNLIDNAEFIIATPVVIGFIFYFVKTIRELWQGRNDYYIEDYNKQRQLRLIEMKIGELDGYEFEDFMGYLFNKMGYNAVNTPKSKDGGKDIILNGNIYVECKRYGEDSVVDADIVKKLYATLVADGLDRGIIVTTNRYTNTAIDLTKQYRDKGVLIERWYTGDILNCCKKLNCTDILIWLGVDVRRAIELKGEVISN